MSEPLFERQDLRHAASLVEVDHEHVDPRTHFRRLKREIQEVRTGEGYKYATEIPGEPEESEEPSRGKEMPRVDAERVGARSGRVTGRLIARTNWTKFATDETERESLPILAILLGALGAVVFLGGLAIRGDQQGLVLGVGVLLLVGAGIAYYFSDATVRQTEYYYRKRVRILMEGEVAEHDPAESDPAEVVASDLSVVYSEDFEIERRGAGGDRLVDRAELSATAEERLDTQHDLVTREIDLDEPAAEVYCHWGG